MRSVRWALLMVAVVSCTGQIKEPPGSKVAPPPPAVTDCSTPTSTAQVYAALSPSCGGCHGASAEFKLFASLEEFEARVVRNPRFVEAGLADQSPLLRMLEGKPGVLQMPPTQPYAAMAAKDPALLSIDVLRCWLDGLTPGAPASALSSSLNRRMHAEYVKRNLFWAFGLTDADFSTGGSDYGLDDPDGLSPRSSSNQYRAQQFGAPHYLEGVPRTNEIGTTFVQITIQVSQAWCLKAANSGPRFYREAGPADGLGTPASASRVKLNLAYLFARVTGEPPAEETMNGLVALFANYEPAGSRTAWVAACAAIVRHPLSLTY